MLIIKPTKNWLLRSKKRLTNKRRKLMKSIRNSSRKKRISKKLKKASNCWTRITNNLCRKNVTSTRSLKISRISRMKSLKRSKRSVSVSLKSQKNQWHSMRMTMFRSPPNPSSNSLQIHQKDLQDRLELR